LYNRLGFEFAAAMGVVLLLVSGWRAAGVAAAARGAAAAAAPTAAPFPGAPLLAVGLENLCLALPPLAVQALRAAFDPPCDVSSGLLAYALLALPALVYGTLFGFVLGLAFQRARTAFIVWVLAASAGAVYWLLAHPPKFSYSPIVGFFPGPLYDSNVPIDRTLWTARLNTLVQALAALTLAALAWDGRRLTWRRLSADWHGERAVLAVLAVAFAAAVVLLQIFAAPLGLRIHRGYIQRSLGGRLDTAHVRLYYDRGALTPVAAAALAAEHEARWEQLAEFFAVAPARPIGSYVYASATQKKRLMGAGATSFEDALHDEFHINLASEAPHPVLTHEMAHIFAAQIDPWVPVCWKMGIHEGIAVAAEWADESARLEMTPHEACAAMDSLGLLPVIEETLSAWGFWTQPGARAYTACGSFVRWLVDTRGMPRFHVLWRRGDFDAAYGESLPELVAAWRRMLQDIVPAPEQLRRAARLFAAGSIFTVRCAREVADLEHAARATAARGDARAAVAAWARVVALDPADESAQRELARAQLQAGDAHAALAVARQLAARPERPGGQDAALRLGGDAAWTLDRFTLADSFYAAAARVASGQDDERAFVVLRAVLADARLAPLLRPALAEPGASEMQAAAALARAQRAAPDSPWPRYLLGRRLFFARQWAEARAELDSARARGLPPAAEDAAEVLALRADFALAEEVAATGEPRRGAAGAAGTAGAAGARPAALRTRAAAGFRAMAQRPGLPAWRRLELSDWADRIERWSPPRLPAPPPAPAPGGNPHRD
jgi:hypothetical protein